MYTKLCVYRRMMKLLKRQPCLCGCRGGNVKAKTTLVEVRWRGLWTRVRFPSIPLLVKGGYFAAKAGKTVNAVFSGFCFLKTIMIVPGRTCKVIFKTGSLWLLILRIRNVIIILFFLVDCVTEKLFIDCWKDRIVQIGAVRERICVTKQGKTVRTRNGSGSLRSRQSRCGMRWRRQNRRTGQNQRFCPI